jgi:arylsulfatase A
MGRNTTGSWIRWAAGRQASVRAVVPLLRLLGAACALALVCPIASAAETTRPNIVYLYADDLGIGDVSCYNPKSAWRTPRMDRLAREGMLFTDAHSASSLCTPSRYALLTGRYPWRGMLRRGVTRGYSAPVLESGRETVATLLRRHGYTTAMLGKWHLGLEFVRKGPELEDVDFTRPFGGGPLAHGFDRFLGISASLDMPPYVWLAGNRAVSVPTGTIGDSPSPKLWRAGAISPDFKLEDVQPRLTQEAIDYIGERAAARDGRPFFLYLALASPHTPILPTPEFEGKTRTTPYGDFVVHMDADIGRVVDALEQHGLARNTLVIVTSDNGFAPAADVPPHASFGHDPSGGFRGVKSDLFEGGHRVPFIARWPGVIAPGSRCEVPIGQWDLLATLAELVGARLAPNAGEDSVSFLPLLRGRPTATAGRDAMVHHSATGALAIRQGKWKLLLCPDSGGWSYPTTTPAPWGRPAADDLTGLPPFQLYDLEADPAEKHNLVERHPDVVQRLGRLLRSYIERGRSTPGEPQPVDRSVPWPQVAWMDAFPK